MKNFLILFFVCTASMALHCNEQIDQLEVILLSAQEVGLGMDVDISRMKESMITVGEKLNCPVHLVELVDKNFGASPVVDSLKAISPTERSLIVFYYSGHGFNNKKKASRWPTLCTCIKCYMRKNSKKGHTPLIAGKSILRYLQGLKKKAALVIFDCCNSRSSDKTHRIVECIRSSQKEYTLELQDDLDSFTNLLCSTKGMVIAAASRVGEFAYGNYGVGGLFTSCFLSSIKDLGRNKSLTWKELFDAASDKTTSRSCEFGSRTQHPIYKIIQ